MTWFHTARALDARSEPQQIGPRPGLFERLAEEPALLELALLAAVGLVVGWLFLRLRARARAHQEEKALGDLVLGLVLAEDRQWEASLPRLEEALAAEPGRVSVRLARARALHGLGRHEEAHAEHLGLRRTRGPGWHRNELGLAAALRAAAGETSGPPGGALSGLDRGRDSRTESVSDTASELRAVSAAARASASAVDEARVRLRPLGDPQRTWEAIRADREHVERLCAVAGPHHVEDVAALGVEAAPSLLRAAIGGGDMGHLAEIIAAIGPAIGPALLEAARAVDPFPGDALRALLSALGASGADALAPHLGNADRRLRHVLIDVLLGTGDVDAFERVLDAVPLVDVVQRCNEVPEQVLVPFLAALPDAHFLFEVLLPEGGFVRDRAVLRAIPVARAPGALERLLVRRGAARSLCSELVQALVDPDVAGVAGRLLDGFGVQALGPMVLAFAHPELAPEVRAAVRVRLVGAGAAAVEPLCACFGAHPTDLDGDVVAVLASIGDVAVPAMRDSCAGRGLLARWSPAGRRRGAHRRAMVVRALGAIGSMQARAALTTLRASESDQEVLLRIAQALHRLDQRRPALEIPRPDRNPVADEREPIAREVDERG